ncbi:MAG: IS1249 family transposase [Actinomycetaceae bacterium]|nr:IS1249 family transposase [Actinomycetaceae bacterium]
MNKNLCPICGGKRVKDGKTKSGKQRWLCKECGSSLRNQIDTSAKTLEMFLGWLSGKKTQEELRFSARTFRRHTRELWSVWPLAPLTGEVHRVVFVDGIQVAKNVHVLIACTSDYVIGWYLARSENSNAWGALMRSIPSPDMVVCDGGTGFEKARKKYWPHTRVQRCLYHVYKQVAKNTTSRPRLEAGVQLYGLAHRLLHVKTPQEAMVWERDFMAWCQRWEEFLSQRTINPETRKSEWTHKPLVQARNSLKRLVKTKVLFTFLDPSVNQGQTFPSTNNQIEGAVNAQIRAMWRNHRGMSTLRRAKAAFWWCYMHSENPLNPADILRTMPTDTDITRIYKNTLHNPQQHDGPNRWGNAIVWADLHHQQPWNPHWD